ncbi:hypothetical protein C8Q77DRAFT_295086 [Trametes polyzona]|nr:hypothetical protein C8Q77DRAFT_295086 [Trametes polyzona]
MLFRSNSREDSKSSQELIILCHGQQRVLVPLPKTYQDAQECAKDVFSLDNDVVFETIDLEGSTGAVVRIHHAAWEGISPILHTVEVVLDENPGRPKAVEMPGTPVRQPSSQKRVAGPNAQPVRTVASAANSPPEVRQASAVKKTPLVVSGNRTDTSTGSSASLGSKRPKASSASKTSQPTSRSAPASIPQAAKPVSSSKSNGVNKPASSAKPPPYVRTPEASDGEEEDEIRILSPTKKRVARPRVLSDYGLDESEGQVEEATQAGVKSDENEEEEEYDELEDAEYISAAPPVAKAKTPSSSQTPSFAAAKSGSSSRSGGRSVLHLDAMPTGGRSAERAPSPKVKVEKSLAKPTPPLQEAAPARPQGKSDESFVIMIEYGDDPESRSLFKTRGRHMVGKVLMQACRTFGIEQYYDHARLVLLIEADGDDGEPTVYRSVCSRDETMAQAGAQPDARFLVEIEEERS